MLYNTAQLTYLEHLGIDVWVPRDAPVESAAVNRNDQQPVLPQAPVVHNEPVSYSAPSHFEDVPAAPQSAPVNSPQAVPVTQQAPIQTPVANEQVPSSVLNSALTSAIPAPAFPLKAQVQDDAAVSRIEFNMQFWCYSSGVWFIAGDVNITPEQHKLVHNLAQFIQGKKRRPRQVNVFSWPMIDSPNVEQGEEIAFKYLQSHIERLQQACEQKLVVAFKDCEYFPDYIPHVKLDVSLQQVLNDPLIKKSLWQQLQALKFQD